MKKKRNTPQLPKKIKIAEVESAYIQLTPETLKSCRVLKQNVDCVRYRSRAIEAAFNKGHRLYIYDHRKEAVSAVKQYKNHKRASIFGNRMSPAKVMIMKKDPGGYYINIYSPDSRAPITATLKEEILTNPLGLGFSISGEPEWWLMGYMDDTEASYIAINDFMEPEKSLDCREILIMNDAV